MQVRNNDPRPSINQGIDTNNAMVLRHTAIYNGALSTITEGMQTVGLMINPYGTAPLSGYLGIWSPTTNPIRVQLTNDIGAIPVDYNYTPEPGANLVPLLGLVPAALNHLTVTIPGIGTASGEIITGPLPPTDAELPSDPSADYPAGFPVIELTVPPVNPPEILNELYFCAFAVRYNVGIDPTATVRWYTTLDIVAHNFERLPNGHFIGADMRVPTMMYEVDLIGRVHTVYVLDNACHHSIYVMPDGNSIMIASENTGTTYEDGISIVDLSTGLETAYYDLRPVLDQNRAPIPATFEPLDWLHINQAYLDTTNNLVVGSGRHQCVFAIDADTGELSFILANHVDWDARFQPYLLTPVDSAGNPLYDLSNPDDVDRADKEFWNWGQHNCLPIGDAVTGIVEFNIMDNGNFRSRNEANALLPEDNYTRLIRYRVNVNNMTVEKVFEYGETEVGNRGYSSYVCNGQALDNGNYFLVFGGGIVDDNGRRCTIMPGITDIVDPLTTDTVEGVVVFQEIDPSTKTPQVEITCTSGRYKTEATDGSNYRNAFYTFRSHKWPLLP